jgi:hypothetical protein
MLFCQIEVEITSQNTNQMHPRTHPIYIEIALPTSLGSNMLTPMTPPAYVLLRRNFSRIICDIFITVARALEFGLEILLAWLPASAVSVFSTDSTIEWSDDRRCH